MKLLAFKAQLSPEMISIASESRSCYCVGVRITNFSTCKVLNYVILDCTDTDTFSFCHFCVCWMAWEGLIPLDQKCFGDLQPSFITVEITFVVKTTLLITVNSFQLLAYPKFQKL